MEVGVCRGEVTMEGSDSEDRQRATAGLIEREEMALRRKLAVLARRTEGPQRDRMI
jgi:hypothetical protein